MKKYVVIYTRPQDLTRKLRSTCYEAKSEDEAKLFCKEFVKDANILHVTEKDSQLTFDEAGIAAYLLSEIAMSAHYNNETQNYELDLCQDISISKEQMLRLVIAKSKIANQIF